MSGKKNTVPYTAIFTAAAVVLYLLEKLTGAESAFGRALGHLAFLCAFLAVVLFWLKHSRDGRRIKAELIDPVLKPSGREKQYWDEDGRLRHSSSDSSPDRRNAETGTRLHFRSGQRSKWLLPGTIAVLAISVLVILTWSRPENALEEFSQDSKGIEHLLEGILHGETEEISEGGSALAHSLLRDLRLLVVALLTLAVIVGIVFVVRRIWIRKKKYHYEEEE